MSTLTREARHVQNEALGAVLLWRYAAAWTEHNGQSAHPPVPLLFVVLPILFHHETLEMLRGTRRTTGLYGFTEKFSRSSSRQADVLMGLHSRALAWRGLTWRCLRLGVRARLITVTADDGTVVPLTEARVSGVPQTVQRLVTNAEKLGEWCANLSIFEVATALKVQF